MQPGSEERSLRGGSVSGSWRISSPLQGGPARKDWCTHTGLGPQGLTSQGAGGGTCCPSWFEGSWDETAVMESERQPRS